MIQTVTKAGLAINVKNFVLDQKNKMKLNKTKQNKTTTSKLWHVKSDERRQEQKALLEHMLSPGTSFPQNSLAAPDCPSHGAKCRLTLLL